MGVSLGVHSIHTLSLVVAWTQVQAGGGWCHRHKSPTEHFCALGCASKLCLTPLTGRGPGVEEGRRQRNRKKRGVEGADDGRDPHGVGGRLGGRKKDKYISQRKRVKEHRTNWEQLPHPSFPWINNKTLIINHSRKYTAGALSVFK